MATRGSMKKFNLGEPVKRLYTIKEAGIYLGRSIYSVRELIWDGKLPCVKVGRRIHLDIRDLDEFIEKHKVRNDF
jgi:excisionase family DNA binding protein